MWQGYFCISPAICSAFIQTFFKVAQFGTERWNDFVCRRHHRTYIYTLMHFKFETSQPQLTRPQRKLAGAPASATATADQRYQQQINACLIITRRQFAVLQR